jgi:SEC-C motif-containing protein
MSKNDKQVANNKECPCGSGKSYDACCRPFVAGESLPGTAEQLMRSRYCAYVLRDSAYLLDTWYRSSRPGNLSLDKETAPDWIGLKVKGTESGGEKDLEGTVEFVARYKVNGKAHRMHEVSRFIKQNNKWFYVDGESGND